MTTEYSNTLKTMNLGRIAETDDMPLGGGGGERGGGGGREGGWGVIDLRRGPFRVPVLLGPWDPCIGRSNKFSKTSNQWLDQMYKGPVVGYLIFVISVKMRRLSLPFTASGLSGVDRCIARYIPVKDGLPLSHCDCRIASKDPYP